MAWSPSPDLWGRNVSHQSDTRDEISEVRRRAGKLREIRTVRGRRFLVLRDPLTERFLEVGIHLEAADIEKLETDLALPAGMAYAYRLLSVRDRTEREIRDALAQEGIPTPGVVDEVVASLKRQGYLDDRRLASGYIRYMLEHRPSGPHLLRRKLRRAGVEENIIEDEIAAAVTAESEVETAERLARIKLGGKGGRERDARRVHGFLTRRGFSSAVVNRICARIVRGEFLEGDDEQ
jgi:SOS response regulatory protein OraA/RecX